MKVWGNEKYAEGYNEDEYYRYHIAIRVEGNIVIVVTAKNKKDKK